MYSNFNQLGQLDSFDFSLRAMEGDQMIDENSSAINISDVIEVIETDSHALGLMEPRRAPHLDGGTIAAGAFVSIVEQPASKALRFRYECEGRSAGSIPGVSSTPENKTFPTVQIVGHKGRAMIVVSCVTKDHPYKPHPHNLVGKDGCKRGVCAIEVNNDNMTATFANLGIQCVKKRDIEEALKVREEIRVDPFRTGFSHKNQPSSIDLNSVRLCFQAFLEGPTPGKFTVPLPPVVSEPIYDKKAMADLVICKLSHCSGSIAGGNEIILLCEKVAKEDITVRFFEEKDGNVIWEAYGDFTPTQVHKQVAISFKTPRYRTMEVDHPVKVQIQLRRPSDNATSEPLPFQFTPLDTDADSIKRKRQKFSHDNELLRQLQETEPMRLRLNDPHPPAPLTIKLEPPESSPNHYMMYPAAVKTYNSRTPSPLDYAGAVGGTGTYQPPSAVFTQVGALYHASPHVYTPAGSPLVAPNGSQQPHHIQQENVQINFPPSSTARQPQPDMKVNNILDMDTQQYSIELNFNRLDSKDLEELSLLDPGGTLSANLSTNLTLNDEPQEPAEMDSLTQIANSELNQLCNGPYYPLNGNQ